MTPFRSVERQVPERRLLFVVGDRIGHEQQVKGRRERDTGGRVDGDDRAVEILLVGVESARDELHRPATLGHEANLGRSEEHTSEIKSLMRISYPVLSLKTQYNTTN